MSGAGPVAVFALLAAGSTALAVLVWPGRGRRRPRRRPVGRPQQRSEAARRRPPADVQLVLELVEMVAAQVRAGAAPTRAWTAATQVLHRPDLAAEPLRALDRLAQMVDRGGGSLGDPAAVAAASAAAGWRLAARTGAPLAELLDSAAAAVRQELDVLGEVSAALAGPRATVRLLTTLPLGGIALGELIGAHPLAVLTGTAAGRVCGVSGVLLLLAGRGWMARQVAGVGASR